MNQTLLIVLGVAVFTVTLFGTLWYFYWLMMRLELLAERQVGHEVPPADGNSEVYLKDQG